MKRYKKRPDGRYAITIMIGYKPNGKPNNIFLSAKTEKELRDKVIEVRMKIKSGQAVKQSDTLLKDYANGWLEIYKASASVNTKAIYNNIVNHHIKPELGHIPLNKLCYR